MQYPPYVPHQVIKGAGFDDLAGAGIGILTQELDLPKLFVRKSYQDLKQQPDDTLKVRVPGRLPARRYAWRYDRTLPIEFDIYKEASVTMTYGDRFYSAVAVTDEQAEFDFTSPDFLLPKQGAAVASQMNTFMASAVDAAPYKFTIGGAEQALRAALLEANRVFNILGLPKQGRILIVGTNFETALLSDPKIVLAQNVGDARADKALTEATLGMLSGFTVVSSLAVDPDSAYALLPSSFVFTTASPYIPNDVKGATISHEGFSMRWIKSYDHTRFVDRSSVDLYANTGLVQDLFVSPKAKLDEAIDVSQLVPSFIRGVKLTLDGDSVYPTAADQVGKDSGLTTPWVAPSPAKP